MYDIITNIYFIKLKHFQSRLFLCQDENLMRRALSLNDKKGILEK